MNQDRSIIISKTLSRLLRHNPKSQIELDVKGAISLDDLVDFMRTISPFKDTGLTHEEVRQTVSLDEKQRFHIDGNRIRALSGHSFEVQSDGEPFYPAGPLYFGTAGKGIQILEKGFVDSAKLKVRLHYTYHDAEVIANSREGEPVVFEIDAERLAADGWSFEKLLNGEILTDPFSGDYVTEAAHPKFVELRVHRPRH
jgi:putative RNA 2'-phosphotransferase